MRTKLQRVCLAVGLALATFAFLKTIGVFSFGLTGGTIYWFLFFVTRLGSAVLAGYVANDIRRGEFLFAIFAFIIPALALITLGLIKPKIIIEDEKQVV